VASTERESPERVRARLEPALWPIFNSEFVVCSGYFDRYVTETAARDLDRLGIVDTLERFASVTEILAEKGFSPRAEAGLRGMLEKLAAEGFLEKDSEGPAARYRRLLPLPTAESGARSRALAVDPTCAPAFAAVDVLSAEIEDFFSGKKSGEEILFAPARLSLWFDYFNNSHVLYAANNRLAAEAAVRAMALSRPSVILELGGGAGSAALALLERLTFAGREGNVAAYNFTETVPTFLRRGERSLKGAFSGVPIAARRLDMNHPFAAQGIAPESCDLVYAVNAIHVAQNLGQTLDQILAVLKPGGHLVFSECVRLRPGQPVYIEYIFNFLDNFVRVSTDPEIRPNHGFLTPAHWRAALARSGFSEVSLLPDVEKLAEEFPNFFLAAFTAKKGR
jgi:SAM-dependent methyltransferase